jgi:hypothetical protein
MRLLIKPLAVASGKLRAGVFAPAFTAALGNNQEPSQTVQPRRDGYVCHKGGMGKVRYA